MSPSRVPKESTMAVKPINHGPGKLCNFGATVSGIDLNDLSDEDLAKLKEATHQHKVIVIKNQHHLEPIKHWELVTRLDPTAAPVHGHGTVKDFKKTGGFLSKGEVIGIPSAPNVRLIGKGYQGADSYGIHDFTAAGGASNSWHQDPPSAAAFQAGHTRFQRWHMDAPLYEREPPHFTALRAVKLPVVPEHPAQRAEAGAGAGAEPEQERGLRVHWDDGSGLSMAVRAGHTAFFSNVQLYGLLGEAERVAAENSWVEYAPFPYLWIEECHGNSTGLGLVTQGREHAMEDMPEWKPEFIKTYPCVWTRPNGEKALQVHGIAVRKLFLKSSPTSPVEVIEDLARIREVLASWQSRILKPEYIFIAPVEEGDVGMWDNWSVFHSAVDYPLSYGPRTMHQANIGASDSPQGPLPIAVS